MAKDLDKLLDAMNLLARDNSRTPVQWDDTPNAGFTTGEPWMKVNPNYTEINAASQIYDPDSLYNFWKESLEVRKQHKELFIYGAFEILDFDNENTFTYIKTSGNSKAYVVLNFSSEPIKFQKLVDGDLELLITNVDLYAEDTLSPYEGRVYVVN